MEKIYDGCIKDGERWYYSEKEVKEVIVSLFNKMYGFAPSKKSIRFAETSGKSFENKSYYDFVGFHINGIGYSLENGALLIRNMAYDM